jgi:hypothetical protein
MQKELAMRLLAFSLITITLLIILSTSVQAQSDPRNKLVGNWAGESICTGKRPACNDEKVVYRIQLNPKNSSSVTIQAYKIVDGKPVDMGTLDFIYDPGTSSLTCDFSRGRTHGLFQFSVEGDLIKGVLSLLPEKEIVRNIKVKKSE